MDNQVLELFARLLSSQQNMNANNFNQQNGDFNGNQNTNFQNPAYDNYPREAFMQSANNSNGNQNQFQESTAGQNNFSGLGNLFNNNNGNMLSLLLSMLGKGGGGGLGGIMEALSKKPSDDKKIQDNADDSPDSDAPIGDEILL